MFDICLQLWNKQAAVWQMTEYWTHPVRLLFGFEIKLNCLQTVINKESNIKNLILEDFIKHLCNLYKILKP